MTKKQIATLSHFLNTQSNLPISIQEIAEELKKTTEEKVDRWINKIFNKR